MTGTVGATSREGRPRDRRNGTQTDRGARMPPVGTDRRRFLEPTTRLSSSHARTRLRGPRARSATRIESDATRRIALAVFAAPANRLAKWVAMFGSLHAADLASRPCGEGDEGPTPPTARNA